MNKIIPSFLTLFTLVLLSACKYDSAAPIRDIRFDPKLVGRIQASGPSACVNHFFNDKGKLKNLGTISPEYVLIAFEPDLNAEGRQEVVKQFGFVEEIVAQANSRSAMLFTLRLVEGLNCQQAEEAIKELTTHAAVQYAAPYFARVVNGRMQLTGISNELVVQVKNNDTDSFQRLTGEYKADMVSVSADQSYLLKVDKHSKGNALETANYLKDQYGIQNAAPEFIVTSF